MMRQNVSLQRYLSLPHFQHRVIAYGPRLHPHVFHAPYRLCLEYMCSFQVAQALKARGYTSWELTKEA